jgi:hypothetical protein
MCQAEIDERYTKHGISEKMAKGWKSYSHLAMPRNIARAALASHAEYLKGAKK